MAFNDIIAEAQTAQIVECFKITIVASDEVWTFTSATEDIDFLADTYLAVPIKRNRLEADPNDPFKSNLDITVDKDNEFIREIIPGMQDSLVRIELFQIHEPTLEYVRGYYGEVLKFSVGEAEATISCATINLDLSKAILHKRYQKQCSHALYSDGCGLTNLNYMTEGELLTVSGATLTATEFDSQDDDYFTGGYLEIGTEKKLIIAHSGTQVTVLSPFKYASVGDNFFAFAGCDHSIATCKSKFGNSLNFGGQPYIPNKVPFGKSIAY
jgi:uncharacterized phage protein (TIGR02218 family)